MTTRLEVRRKHGGVLLTIGGEHIAWAREYCAKMNRVGTEAPYTLHEITERVLAPTPEGDVKEMIEQTRVEYKVVGQGDNVYCVRSNEHDATRLLPVAHERGCYAPYHLEKVTTVTTRERLAPPVPERPCVRIPGTEKDIVYFNDRFVVPRSGNRDPLHCGSIEQIVRNTMWSLCDDTVAALLALRARSEAHDAQYGPQAVQP
jgi:hypothetical protein